MLFVLIKSISIYFVFRHLYKENFCSIILDKTLKQCYTLAQYHANTTEY